MDCIIGDSYKTSIADFYINKIENSYMKSDMKYPEFAKRLSTAWKNCHAAPEKQTPLSKWLGFSQPTVNDWLNGKGLPSMDTALKLSGMFGCNIEWLLTGQGPMRPGEEIADPLYKKIIDLSPEQRSAIELMVNALNNTPKPENKPLTNPAENVWGGQNPCQIKML